MKCDPILCTPLIRFLFLQHFINWMLCYSHGNENSIAIKIQKRKTNKPKKSVKNPSERAFLASFQIDSRLPTDLISGFVYLVFCKNSKLNGKFFQIDLYIYRFINPSQRQKAREREKKKITSSTENRLSKQNSICTHRRIPAEQKRKTSQFSGKHQNQMQILYWKRKI